VEAVTVLMQSTAVLRGAGADHGDAGDREAVSAVPDAVGAARSIKVRC
jgi:hypothetical protein